MDSVDDQLLLIDLSAIGHQIWHVSGSEPDPSYVSTQIIARVRSLAASHPHAAICCDSGKSFRAEIDPTYKANRDTENRAPLRHQMDVACATLKRDGFPVWAVKGFEADDLIATAVAKAADIDETSVLIVTADKDLFQLVTDRVAIKSIITGNVIDAAAVREKFKVTPAQMHDYLCLVGDTSDNIVGAEGVGPVTAAAILLKFGTLANFYMKLDAAQMPPDMKRRAKFLADEFGIGDKQRIALMEFKDRWPTVSKLIALRADAPIPFEEIAAERDAAPMVEDDLTMALTGEGVQHGDGATTFTGDLHAAESSPAAPASTYAGAEAVTSSLSAPKRETSGSSPDGAVVAYQQAAKDAGLQVLQAPPPPPEWELQLEPRTYRDLRVFAEDVHGSRKFMRNFGSPQAAIMAVMSGRELGVPAMASLRGFHSVEDGPPMPNADLVRSIVIKSGKVEYFEPTERSATAAEFIIKRVGRPEVKLRYTIEEGRTAYGFDAPMNDKERADLERKWQKSGWGKNVADMLVARASMKLGRLVCPDVCAGLYAREEMD